MKERIISKGLVVAVILLLFSISVTPTIGISNNDDTTPPVTTHTLNPPEPDGLNSWYVSDVKVTLTATDDLSGVKEIRYTINGGVEHVIPGDNGTFFHIKDGKDILFEYWAIDNAGNVETPKNWFTINLDETVPDIYLTCEGKYYPYYGWTFDFIAYATDDMSGMERVEFYMNRKFQKTVTGKGPEYEYIWDASNISYVRGFIRNPMITGENVSLYVRMGITFEGELRHPKYPTAKGYDEAGLSYWDELIGSDAHIQSFKILLFRNITLPNNYMGFIGNNFIFARFDTSQVN